MSPHPKRPGTFAYLFACLFACLMAGNTPALAADRPGADYFPNIALTTQDGKQVRFYDDLLKGKSVAINLIYTSCTDECPLETARMAEVQRLLGNRMGKDIVFYSISIDPEHDTPKVLKAYAKKFDVGPGWLFLTGKKDDIKMLTKKLGLSRGSDAANRDGHAASLMLGNEPGGQWMRNSAVDNPQFLVATMHTFFGWGQPLPAMAGNDARPVDISKAQFLYQSRCASCHDAGSNGKRIGPNLAGVTGRRDPAWLARFIQQPDRMVAEGDPTAMALFNEYQQVQMPNLRLNDEEVAALVAYLDQGIKVPVSSAGDGHGPAHAHHKH